MANPRTSTIASISQSNPYDIAIIGGGIHGAACARLAALTGLKVILLEKSDFASETSSRSSKMAHGGLRYLEMFDFEQVFEGIKARNNLFATSDGLVRPENFLIPVSKGDYFFKTKLAVGLFLYDLFLKDKKLKHKWLSSESLSEFPISKYKSEIMGCFQYTDGLMSDSRLVVENIKEAANQSALCLNYCEVTNLHKLPNSRYYEVNFLDNFTQQNYQINASAILNCTGPWIKSLDPNLNLPTLQFSRGIHIVFTNKWIGPSLFLPMEGKSRYYFVWPHRYGTMVGTTEREVPAAEFHPIPNSEEIDELLKRIETDLPESGLSRKTAHSAFCGVRTIPSRQSRKNVETASRKHIWSNKDGLITLSGGKFTTSYWTALEGINLALTHLNRPALPKQVMSEMKINTSPLAHVAIYGISPEADIVQLSEEAIRSEFACTLEDIVSRRLEVEHHPEHGVPIIDTIVEILKAHFPERDFTAEKEKYIEKISIIKKLLT